MQNATKTPATPTLPWSRKAASPARTAPTKAATPAKPVMPWSKTATKAEGTISEALLAARPVGSGGDEAFPNFAKLVSFATGAAQPSDLEDYAATIDGAIVELESLRGSVAAKARQSSSALAAFASKAGRQAR